MSTHLLYVLICEQNMADLYFLETMLLYTNQYFEAIDIFLQNSYIFIYIKHSKIHQNIEF